MTLPTIQTSFNAGELAPSLWGNVDFARVHVGASTMRNMVVSYRGGAFSRAGTAFVGYSKQSIGNIASGTIFFASNPSNGDTITLNGVVITFVTGTPTGNQIQIGGSTGITIGLGLVPFLLASTNPALSVANYIPTGGGSTATLNIYFKIASAAGNAYTLAASVATPSGATLTGGAGPRTIPPRLITFQFNLNQGLALEFGNLYMRVIKDGAFVLESPVSITGITQALPGVVTTSPAVPSLANGDQVFLAGISGMTQLNIRSFVARGVSGSTFALYDVFGNPIDTRTYGAWTSGGSVQRYYTLVTPYSDADLDFLKFTQSADVMSLTCRNQITGTEYQPYDLARVSDTNWTLTALSTGPSITPPTSLTGTAANTTMTNPTDYKYEVTAISAVDGGESVASIYADINNSVDISATAGSIALTWPGVAGASYYNIYKAPPAAFNETVPVGSLFGFAGTTYDTNFVDSNIVEDLTQVPPLHRNPFVRSGVVGVTVNTPGSGLSGIAFNITTSTGSGFQGFGVLSGGALQQVVIQSSGQNYSVPPDTITFYDPTGTAAAGSITFSANPSNGDTITLNGYLITFVSGAPVGPQVHIDTLLTVTIGLNLINFLAAAVNPLLTVANYAPQNVGPNVKLNVTYGTTGSVGNAYTLAASVATPSGPNLTGGTGGVSPTGTLVLGPASGTYPSVVAYFQERRVYANTINQPDTYWMSQPGAFKNFDSRVPTIDSDAIVGTPWSVQVDGIQFMLPILGGLVVLTGEAAYQVMGSGGSPSNPQPVTPSSQQALPQAYNGCHFHVPPIKIDYDVYYLQAKGSVIRSLSYNFWINVFTGVDVTYLSSHLFTGFNINAMAWCEEPYKVLWCVRDDGVLLSLTSLKTQDVMGWARHDTQGLFLSATSVAEPPVDALYVATQRFRPDGNSPYMIERMDNRIWTAVEDAWCVDAGLAYGQSSPAANLTIVGHANGSGVPTGVTGLVGGLNYGIGTVGTIADPTGTGCTVTLSISPANGSITAATLSGGTLYTNPVIQFVDPTGKGSGASATVVLTNTVTINSDTAIFSGGSVGNVIRGGGGIMEITAYVSTTQVTAAVVSPIVDTLPDLDQPYPMASGSWTLSVPTNTITNLNHLEGLTVTGLADGNVIPPTVVVNGAIALSGYASAITVGLPFKAQLQSLYLERGQQPTVQGRRAKIGAVTVRVDSSSAFQAGTCQPDGSVQSPIRVAPPWTGLQAVDTNRPNLAQIAYGTAQITGSNVTRPVPLFTGDVRVEFNTLYAKPGQVAVQQSTPRPLNVLAFIRESTVGDTPEQDPRQQPKGGQ